MPRPRIEIDDETKERTRLAHLDRTIPVARVVEISGRSTASFYRLREQEDWPLRQKGRPRKPRLARPVFRSDAGQDGSVEPVLGAEEAEVAPAAEPTLARRLRRLLAHRIALLEHEAARGDAVDPERNARALALNARTLTVLQGLPDGSDKVSDDPGRPPRTLAELRDELRRHLERIADEESDPGLGGDAGAG